MLEKYLNKVLHKDIMQLLKELPDNCIDMVYGDPDYNVGIKYGEKTYTKNFEEYIDWYTELAKESLRVLKEDGNMFLMGLRVFVWVILSRSQDEQHGRNDARPSESINQVPSMPTTEDHRLCETGWWANILYFNQFYCIMKYDQARTSGDAPGLVLKSMFDRSHRVRCLSVLGAPNDRQ